MKFDMIYIRKKLAQGKRAIRRLRIDASTLAITAVAVLAVATGLIFGNHIINSSSKIDPNAKIGSLNVSEDNSQASAFSISIIINTSPVFENGRAKGSIFFENPSYSGKYERLEIYRDDTGELIFSSGFLKPGSYIDYAPLIADLDAGEYSCTAVISGYRTEDQEFIGRAAAAITVYVLE